MDDQYVSAYTEPGYSDYALKNYDDALYYFKPKLRNSQYIVISTIGEIYYFDRNII